MLRHLRLSTLAMPSSRASAWPSCRYYRRRRESKPCRDRDRWDGGPPYSKVYWAGAAVLASNSTANRDTSSLRLHEHGIPARPICTQGLLPGEITFTFMEVYGRWLAAQRFKDRFSAAVSVAAVAAASIFCSSNARAHRASSTSGAISCSHLVGSYARRTCLRRGASGHLALQLFEARRGVAFAIVHQLDRGVLDKRARDDGAEFPPMVSST